VSRILVLFFLFVPVALLCSQTSWTSKPPKLDHSGAAVVIDYVHHQIHDGEHFFVIGNFSTDTAEINRCVRVPSNSQPHVIWGITSSQDTTAEIYEAASFTYFGDALLPINSDRNSAQVALISPYHNSIVASTGTLIWSQQFGEKKTGGQLVFDDEIILKENTDYLFRTTSTGSYWISGRLRWYEP
jgi:hypothetical protein